MVGNEGEAWAFVAGLAALPVAAAVVLALLVAFGRSSTTVVACMVCGHDAAGRRVWERRPSELRRPWWLSETLPWAWHRRTAAHRARLAAARAEGRSR